MTEYLKVAGTHKPIRKWLKVAGTWKPVGHWYKVSGTWKQVSTGAGIFLSAPFDDITDVVDAATTDGNTVTLTVIGGPLTLSITNLAVYGNLRMSKNGGTFNLVGTPTDSVSVANGDTLQFRYKALIVGSDTILLSESGYSVDAFDVIGT